MGWDFALFCLIGGLVYLDTDAVGQFMISQPLAACTAAGAILGNWPLGLAVGLILQLPYLVEIPVGGTKVALGNVGAYLAAGVAVHLTGQYDLAFAYALLIGVAVSWVGIPLQDGLRRINLHLVKKADAAGDDGNLQRISRLQYSAAGLALVFGAALCGLFFLFAVVLWKSFFSTMTSAVSFRGEFIPPLLLGAGAGAALWLFVNRRTLRFMIFGAGLGAVYLIFDLII